MNMGEVGFQESTIKSLNEKPLLRDNLKNIEKDFIDIYERVIFQDMGDTPEEALIKIKSDLFAAFCHGAQMATRPSSKFRQGFKMPAEFGGKTAIITPDQEIVKPKLDLIL